MVVGKIVLDSGCIVHYSDLIRPMAVRLVPVLNSGFGDHERGRSPWGFLISDAMTKVAILIDGGSLRQTLWQQFTILDQPVAQ